MVMSAKSPNSLTAAEVFKAVVATCSDISYDDLSDFEITWADSEARRLAEPAVGNKDRLRLDYTNTAYVSFSISADLSSLGLTTAEQLLVDYSTEFEAALDDGDLTSSLESYCDCEAAAETATLALSRNYPTIAPTQAPTGAPSQTPSTGPTSTPTLPPSHAPTHVPSLPPSHGPSPLPTPHPTHVPTSPTHPPTPTPTQAPSHTPTQTGFPSPLPTPRPTHAPSHEPTHIPTTWPPTAVPTPAPSHFPTPDPTHLPTDKDSYHKHKKSHIKHGGRDRPGPSVDSAVEVAPAAVPEKAGAKLVKEDDAVEAHVSAAELDAEIAVGGRHGRAAARLAAAVADAERRLAGHLGRSAPIAEEGLAAFERTVDEAFAEAPSAAVGAKAAKAQRVVSVFDLPVDASRSMLLAEALVGPSVAADSAEGSGGSGDGWEGDRLAFSSATGAALAVVGGLAALVANLGADPAAAHIRRRGYEEMADTADLDTPL